MDYGCSFGGNAFFLAAYSVLIPLQLNYVIRCRTWGFSYDTLGGMIFEALGYASRVIASQDTNARGYFTTSSLCHIIGPTFFSMALNPCLRQVLDVYVKDLAYLRPLLPSIFIADIGVLALLALGGGMVIQSVPSTVDGGIKFIQVGLIGHLSIMIVYTCLSSELAHAAQRSKSHYKSDPASLRTSDGSKTFAIALETAAIAITIRTAYRVADFISILPPRITDNETVFFALEGTMVLLAAAILTACHPGTVPAYQASEADVKDKKKRQRGE